MVNQVVTKGNSLLLPDKVYMLTIIRLDRDFMQFMR